MGLMSSPPAEDVLDAFIRFVRQRLERGETAEIPGLGTFSVEHQASDTEVDSKGQTSLTPPRNVVRFDPDQ